MNVTPEDNRNQTTDPVEPSEPQLLLTSVVLTVSQVITVSGVISDANIQ